MAISSTQKAITTERVRTRLKEPRVFYTLVVTAVLLPNLVLGVLGFVELRGARDLAAETVTRALRRTLATSLAEARQAIAAAETDLMRVADAAAAEIDDPMSRAWSTLPAKLARVDRLGGGMFEAFFFVDPNFQRLLPAHDRAGPLVPNAGAGVSPDVSGAEALARERFRTRILPELRLLHFPETEVWQRIHHRTLWLDGKPQTYALLPLSSTHGVPRALLVAALDRRAVRAVLEAHLNSLATSGLSPRVVVVQPGSAPPIGARTTVILSAGVASAPEAGADPPVADDTAALAPYWATLDLSGLEALDAAHAQATTRFLTWLAILLPVAAVGGFFLVRAFARELREARLKTDFVSRVTHELKTPLTAIRMFVEMLQEGRVQSEAERQKSLDIIQQEAERLTRLIDRVLDFSKLEVKNKVFHFQESDPAQVIRDTVELFRRQIADSGGTIRLDFDKNLPRMIMDRDAIREVLLNLLSNALKYSVGHKRVIIRASRDKHHLNVAVIDNGIGIPKEDLRRIFEKFFRVDEQLTRGIEGTGLGLTLAREIARAHKGDILVESARGRGSKFTLVVPLEFKSPDD